MLYISNLMVMIWQNLSDKFIAFHVSLSVSIICNGDHNTRIVFTNNLNGGLKDTGIKHCETHMHVSELNYEVNLPNTLSITTNVGLHHPKRYVIKLSLGPCNGFLRHNILQIHVYNITKTAYNASLCSDGDLVIQVISGRWFNEDFVK